MQCKCGGEIVERVHSIKTKRGADIWAEGCYSKTDFPLTVEQPECKACGRSDFRIKNKDNKIIKKK